ncbi:hypothetical protein [Pseudonocardia sp.]|uniref:hypothetical protein n=1 Tax=Pseudonocardia sp. TaxID=60912 RepID=UPI00262F12B3|nr:hypothetical protein [Pseudonocardia sp.]
MPRTFLVCSLLVLLAATGCGAPAPAAPASGTPEVISAAEEARGEPAADAVDACALLSEAEVEALIGPNGGASPTTGGGDGGGCTWENPENYHSVTLDVGSSGTAAAGVLPPLDPAFGPEQPLGDGMRALAGAVEFVAADRLCLVQVATNDTTAEGDEQAAVRLARQVRDLL